MLKRNQRQKQIERNERQRRYQKECKQRLKQRATDEKSENDSLDLNAFRHRTSRARAINRLKSSLPRTPNKRTVVLHKYLSSDSPVASNVKKKESIIDPELSDTVKSAENILTNVKTFIEATKRKRTDEARITMNVVTASIIGENLKSKTNLAIKD